MAEEGPEKVSELERQRSTPQEMSDHLSDATARQMPKRTPDTMSGHIPSLYARLVPIDIPDLPEHMAEHCARCTCQASCVRIAYRCLSIYTPCLLPICLSGRGPFEAKYSIELYLSHTSLSMAVRKFLHVLPGSMACWLPSRKGVAKM